MSKNIDDKKIEGINDEFQDIALRLQEIDFSQKSNEKKVYDKLIENIEKSDSMRKINLIKKCSVAAVVIAATGIFATQNSQAKDVFAGIINKISLGHVTVVEETEGVNTEADKPELYDESGKVVNKSEIEKGGTFYTKDGDVIKIESEDDYLKDMVSVKEINKINDYTCFNVKLPSYLPQGYEFKEALFFKDENGEIVKDSKYADITFINLETGKEFYLQERLDCEETKYTMSSDGAVEKVTINGVDAILSGGRDIDWISEGTIYGLMGKELNKDEVIKVAESIK